MIGMPRQSDQPGADAAIGVPADTAALDNVAADLYGVPTDEFTASRNARAKQARDGGDRDLGAAISKLTKPTAAAWLANQLVREAAGELAALLHLGESMRQATAALDRDELRRLSREQRTAMAALVRRARDLASAAGQRINDAAIHGLEDTLHAALADPYAADELATGRLVGTLHSSGFPVGGADTTTTSRPDARTAAPTGRRAEQDRSVAVSAPPPTTTRRAERDEQRLRDADVANAARDEALAALDRADEVVRDSRARVERLRAELDEAVAAQRQADRDARDARVTAERAERAAQLAARRTGGRK